MHHPSAPRGQSRKRVSEDYSRGGDGVSAHSGHLHLLFWAPWVWGGVPRAPSLTAPPPQPVLSVFFHWEDAVSYDTSEPAVKAPPTAAGGTGLGDPVAGLPRPHALGVLWGSLSGCSTQ